MILYFIFILIYISTTKNTIHFLFSLLIILVSSCVCKQQVIICGYAYESRGQKLMLGVFLNCFPRFCFCFFFWDRLSLNLELINWLNLLTSNLQKYICGYQTQLHTQMTRTDWNSGCHACLTRTFQTELSYFPNTSSIFPLPPLRSMPMYQRVL